MGTIRPGEHDQDSPLAPPERRGCEAFEGWRRRSVIGAIATGVALGLKEIFQPGDNKPVVTAVAPGDPPDADIRLRVVLDPDDPTKSVAFLPRERESGSTEG
jgi:hypothetical protein